MAEVTVDVPATVITAAPGSGSFNPAALSTVSGDSFTGNINMAQFVATSAEYTVIGNYGDGPLKFNWSLPAGSALVSMHYVIRAYREDAFSSPPGDATAVAAAAQFGSVPASLPAAVMRSDLRGPTPYFPDMEVSTTFTGIGDLLVEESDPNKVLIDDAPFDQFTSVQSDSLRAVVKWDYLAIRVVYNDAPVVTGIPWLRLTNRDELRGSGRRSIQGSNRLTGYA